tara:strand:+ start:84 stop:260 length:177 start_codon:yes stop_codon:yes gene_type:complete
MLYILAGFAGGLIATVITQYRNDIKIEKLKDDREEFLVKFNNCNSEMVKLKKNKSVKK